MAIYQLKTFDDIVQTILEEAKIQAGDTVSVNRIKRDVNIAYEDVVSKKNWRWLDKRTTLTAVSALTTGTVNITINSASIIFSVAPAYSVEGYKFSVDGQDDIYTIDTHTAGATTATLKNKMIAPTNTVATYILWTDALALPVDVNQTKQVTQNYMREPMKSLGMAEFQTLVSTNPKLEGRPQWYCTGDYLEPSPYVAITSIPASISRASSGLTKTIVFAANVSSYLTAGKKYRITGASDPTYNVEMEVVDISTTTNTNDTITYTSTQRLYEVTTSDTGIVIKELSQKRASEAYRPMYIYPSIYTQANCLLNVEYVADVTPLDDDDDEPLMPIEDRLVLVYYGLYKTWARLRNPEASASNFALYEKKIGQMSGKFTDALEPAHLTPSKLYLRQKRNGYRVRSNNRGSGGDTFGGGSGGGSSSEMPTSTASRVAIFGADGILAADTLVTPTELEYIDGALSSIRGISDTATLTNKSIDAITNNITNIADANVKSAAAIAVNKLAAQTASVAAVYDASGFLTASVVTPTELTYLTSVEALTTFTMADNQAAAANVATFTTASFDSFVVSYSIKRGASNKAMGTLLICTDGTNASISDVKASIGTVGVTFSADISGATVRLRYTSTSTGTAPSMKYKLQKWVA